MPVALSLYSGSGSGLSGATTVATDATGKSVFSTLSFSKVGGGNILLASGGSLKAGLSAAFNITQGRTTNVVSGPTNVNYGQTFSLTARVGVVAPANGSPSGTVTFRDGPVVLGTAPLVAAQANFTVTNRLTAGVHFFSGVFSGDTNFTGSTSAYFTVNVAKLPLTVTGITASNKIYDATVNAAINTATAALGSGILPGDSVRLDTSLARGTFADKNVGANKPVAISRVSLTGTNAANYTVVQPSATASIQPAALTVAARAANKNYDGATTATVTLTENRFRGDLFTDSFTSAQFADKNVGAAKLVTVSGISISGADAANYFVSNTVATTTANINAARIGVSGVTVSNKVYDAKNTAALNVSSATIFGMIAGDGLTLVSTNARGAFANKSVGVGKAVTVSGFTISGTNAPNYTLVQPTGLTASISPASLTIIAKGVNKIYDGKTNATVTLSDTRFVGDALTDSYKAAWFADAAVATNKSVFVSGLAVTGVDAANYQLQNTNATTVANMTPAKLTVSADNLTRVFGATNPPFTFSISGFVNGETAATAITGAPILATTAKTNSAPTNYPITVAKGTLAAANYFFAFSNGVLTVAPANTVAQLSSGLNPARTNQNITFFTRVSSLNSSVAPNGQVRFKCNGTNTLGAPVGLTNGATTFVVPAALIASSSAVVVTAEFSDPAGNFNNSSNAITQTIVITPPPATIGQITITPPSAPGQFTASLSGTPGQAFVLQASTDLVNWIPISTNIADANGMVSIVESNSLAFPRRFYRGVLPAP